MARRRKAFPDLVDWLPTAQAEITDHLARFVRFLAADRAPRTPEAWASTVPATIGGTPMLLTAKHVVDRLQGRRLLLEIPERFQPIDLRLGVASSNEVDVVAIQLPASSFDWGIEFLDLDPQHEPQLSRGEVEIFIGTGFPVRETSFDLQRANIDLHVVNYWSFEAVDLYETVALDPELWLLTRFDRKRAYRAGLQQAMKLPHGMSGGGLWRFWGPDTEFPTLARGALAGLLVEFREGQAKCFVAARIDAVKDVAGALLNPA